MFGIKRLSGVVVMAVVSMFPTSIAIGQEAQREGGRRQRQNGDQRPRRERGEFSGPDGFRGFGGPGGRGGPREFTAQDRERFEEMMVDRYMDRLTRDYELDDEQQAQVRSQFDQLREHQKTFTESRSGEFETLRNQMRELRSAADEGGQFDWGQARELGERMRTLWQDAPLMNREQIRENVEKLLPAEQAELGRARWDSEEQERNRRREEMRERFAERRQEWEARQAREADPESADGAVEARDPVGLDEAADADGAERRRDRRQGRDELRRQRREQQEQSQTQEEWSGQGQLSETETRDQGINVQRNLPENPIGPWEQYVRDFTRRYRLDASQQVTAQSVLREMQQRRTTYEQTRRGDFEAAQRIEDAVRRQQRMEELHRPVARLFEELKSRLERIPTPQQRRVDGNRSSATQPATSEPADTTSRPADAGQQNRRTREGRRNRGD
ncbi:MAG: hypothetical protein GXY44_01780 [Phycisphaerales bacterium]|nr:hypothetical protein [Phycisphaerales bacterium]